MLRCVYVLSLICFFFSFGDWGFAFYNNESDMLFTNELEEMYENDAMQTFCDMFVGEDLNVINMRLELLFNSKLLDVAGDGSNLFIKELHNQANDLYYQAFQGMTQEQKDLVSKHTIVLGLAAAKPIPRYCGKEVLNIYPIKGSSDPRFSKKNSRNHNRKMKTILTKREKTYSIGGNHDDYLDNIYQICSDVALSEFEKTYGLYRSTN